MKKIFKTIATLILAFLIAISVFGSIVQAKDILIKDLLNTDDAYQQIQWVVSQGYMDGDCFLNSDLEWTFEFISNKYSNKDLFRFYLPKNIASRDMIKEDSNIDHIITLYIDKGGVGYAFDTSDFYYFDDKWTLTINKFGGKGNYIEGTIEGILNTSTYNGNIDNTVTCTKGKFRIKIEN